MGAGSASVQLASPIVAQGSPETIENRSWPHPAFLHTAFIDSIFGVARKRDEIPGTVFCIDRERQGACV